MKTKLADIYLDYVNNFLTLERFAEHYGIPFDAALPLIKAGESCHEARITEVQS